MGRRPMVEGRGRPRVMRAHPLPRRSRIDAELEELSCRAAGVAARTMTAFTEVASDEVAAVVASCVGWRAVGGQGQGRQQHLSHSRATWSGRQQHTRLPEEFWKCPFPEPATCHPAAT
eukprot:14988571-Alexandrium_andersonii.AAC.1